MSTDLKTSLLINRQVPEFVREEYPLFIQFLEAYYEFLETEQGTQNNDLTTKAKDLRFISDVDESIDEFQQYFLDNFASLVPQDALVDKAFLVMFTIEIGFQIIHRGCHIFENEILTFDFLIVIASWLFQPIQTFRIIRAFRIASK